MSSRAQAPERTRPSLWLRLRSLVVFGAVTAVVGWLGSTATSGSVDTEWFRTLDKPAFYPPNAAFGIVWTILYVLVAVAGWLAWRHGGGYRVLAAWTIQIALNLGWSVVFFGLQQPGWALLVVVALLAAAIWTAVAMLSFSRLAAGLFIPYVLWIGFATVLNVSIVALN